MTLDPAEFTTKIDNPYPLRVGSRWVYRETDKEGARLRVVVTGPDRTKLIANGVTARVVHDVVTGVHKGQAEDRAKVISLRNEVKVPFGSFEDVLKIKDVAPLGNPKVFEHRLFAKGIGLVEAFAVSGGSDHEVLVKFKRG